MAKLVKRFPSHPYVRARMGRLCLEAGRKQEAIENFNIIHKLMKPKTNLDNPLESLTGNTSEDVDLEVLCLMNRGYVFIYDGNFREAIDTFRKILSFKPANIVVANNCSTCQM
jgi:tetratricopeptide (TPR) repeat protein